MKISSYLLLGVLFSISLAAEFSADNDITHGHQQSFFDRLEQLKFQGKWHDRGTLEFQDDVLYVHLISHSHDDVGFLKTVDQYFTGAGDMITRAGVRYVLDEVILELLIDPEKRFTYVEMAHFSRWWELQSPEMKDKVRMLVKEGRLEFANGGWSTNDEATCNYEDAINNMRLGHEFLLREFGVIPKVGWSIDAYGHSSAQAALFAEMGFNSQFFARIDFQDKQKRLNESSMEFVWRPFSKTLGRRAEIFTHTMYQNYWPPESFCWDDRCEGTAQPVVDNPHLATFNAPRRVEEFKSWVIHQAQHYSSNHILVPMGSDFHYQNANQQFVNIMRLIKNFNMNNTRIKLLSSTPSIYTKAVHKSGVKLPVNTADFFPYADGPDSYWTGYFTSRAVLKGYIRDSSNEFRASDKLLALQALNAETDVNRLKKNLAAHRVLDKAMGIVQHHESITGTSMQHVADDYADYLFQGTDANDFAYKNAIAGMFLRDRVDGEQLERCHITNQTYLNCSATLHLNNTGERMLVVLFNPGAARVGELARVKVPHPRFAVETLSGDEVQSEVIGLDRRVERGDRILNFDLYFWVEKIGALSSAYFVIKVVDENRCVPSERPSSISMGSQTLTLKWPGHAVFNYTRMVADKKSVDTVVAVDYRYYQSYEGDGQDSGAFIFRPRNESGHSASYWAAGTKILAYRGKLVQVFEIHNYRVDTNVMLFKGQEDGFDVETILGDIEFKNGTEVTANFIVEGIDNKGRFSTDSNGLEMQERRRDERPTFKIRTNQTVAANFYPVTSCISIRDLPRTLMRGLQLNVLPDHAQGGSSIVDGSVELMIQRRLYKDDERGVRQPLNETNEYGKGIHVITRHRVQLFNAADEENPQRKSQVDIFEEPLQIFFLNATNSIVAAINNDSVLDLTSEMDENEKGFAKLKGSIKFALHPMTKDTVLARVYNLADGGDAVELNLDRIAAALYQRANPNTKTRAQIKVTETSITGNQERRTMEKHRLHWNTEEDQKKTYENKECVDEGTQKVCLEGQRIRTFKITAKGKKEHTLPNELRAGHIAQ